MIASPPAPLLPPLLPRLKRLKPRGALPLWLPLLLRLAPPWRLVPAAARGSAPSGFDKREAYWRDWPLPTWLGVGLGLGLALDLLRRAGVEVGVVVESRVAVSSAFGVWG